jgi:hypothetical protein
MLGSVVLVRTGVSEERSTSIIRETRINEQLASRLEAHRQAVPAVKALEANEAHDQRSFFYTTEPSRPEV